MPYKLSQTDAGYFVINTETGEKKNKEPLPEARAKKYMAALYAAENATTKAEGRTYTYNGVSVTASPRRPSDRSDKKYMREVTYRGDTRVVHYGDPEMPMQRDNPERRANFLARHNCDEKSDPFTPGFWACLDWQRTEEGKKESTTIKELFLDLLSVFGYKAKKDQPVQGNDLTVFKDASGAYRWVLISSNAYRDRDGEIVSQKALQTDVDRADADGDYGPLRWWHVPGLDIGDTDFNMLNGKFLVESGTFHNPEIAEAVKADADNLQGSIGFRHPANEPNANGEFETIRRFERSLVPRGRASNPFTSLTVKEGEDMTTLTEKYQAFKALLQDDQLATHILQQVESKEKELDAAGVAFKETTDTTPDPETLTPKKETAGVLRQAQQPPDDAAMSHKADEEGDPDEGEKPADEMAAMKAMMTELKSMMEEMKGMYAKKDDTAAQLEAERQTTLKAYGDKLTTLETNLTSVAKAQADTMTTLKEAQKEIKALMGDLPKNISGYIASAAEDTVVKEGDERFKDAEPHADPLADFSKNFVFKGTPFATQTN